MLNATFNDEDIPAILTKFARTSLMLTSSSKNPRGYCDYLDLLKKITENEDQPQTPEEITEREVSRATYHSIAAHSLVVENSLCVEEGVRVTPPIRMAKCMIMLMAMSDGISIDWETVKAAWLSSERKAGVEAMSI